MSKKDKAFNAGLEASYPYELIREEGGYFVHHPDLLGCFAQGETPEEAVANLDVVRGIWIHGRLQAGLSIPEPANVNLEQIVLRMPANLYERVSVEAAKRQQSVNLFINSTIAEVIQGVGPRFGIDGKEVGNGPHERHGIFISYSHKDTDWLSKFQTVLRPLERRGLLVWDDTRIAPGSRWLQELRQALRETRVGLLLVTPNFLASRFIEQEELPPLLLAAKRDGCRILWVAVSTSLYKETVIGEFQCANDPSKPLDRCSKAEQNRQIVKICENIINVVE